MTTNTERENRESYLREVEEAAQNLSDALSDLEEADYAAIFGVDRATGSKDMNYQKFRSEVEDVVCSASELAEELHRERLHRE